MNIYYLNDMDSLTVTNLSLKLSFECLETKDEPHLKVIYLTCVIPYLLLIFKRSFTSKTLICMSH